MKFVSWNVNGIRACVQKGFMDFFKEADADIFCIQESKMQRNVSRDRSRLNFRAIISTGIMQTGRDIPERRSLQSRSRFLFFMG